MAPASNAVFSFVRTSNETSGSVNIKATFSWLSSEGWLTNATPSTVQFGWDIRGGPGQLAPAR